MDLSTTTRVKILLEITTSGQDALIGQIISSISPDAEKVMNREAEEKSRTEQINVDPGQQRVFLRAFPVKDTPVATIKNDSSRDFASALNFAADEFYLNLRTGEVAFDRRTLIAGPGTLQVIYTGGMGTNTADFISRFPHIAQAIDIQTAFIFKRKETLGLTGFSADGGSVSLAVPNSWISAAREALLREKAMRVGS